MVAETIVREAVPADAGTVAHLLHDFNVEFDSPTPDSDTLALRFGLLLPRRDVSVLLAERGDKAVGFASLTLRPTPYYEGPLAQLEELYVRPEVRGQGIGTRLLTDLVALVRRRGGGEIDINVDESDVDARRFYERHGFTNRELGSDYRMLCYLRELGPDRTSTVWGTG